MPPAGTSSPVDDRPVSAGAAAEGKQLEDAPPDVRLLVKRRQMFEVQEALEAQKEKYAAQVRPAQQFGCALSCTWSCFIIFQCSRVFSRKRTCMRRRKLLRSGT